MELFIKLGLKEICYIVNRMGLTTDVEYLEGNLEVDGIKYHYEKRGNEVVIADENNKKVRVGINYTEEPTKDNYGRTVVYVKHEISVDYSLENGEYLNLYNNISLDLGYESFENVQRHDLMSGLRTRFFSNKGEEVASLSIGLDKICLAGSNQIYEFNDGGILVGRKFISEDGQTLISISGVETPAKELIDSFDVEKEKAKIDRIINESSDLHPFSIESLEDAKRLLDRRERYVKDINDYYNKDIENVKKAIAVRERIISSLEKGFIDAKGIDAVASDYIRQTTSRRLGK